MANPIIDGNVFTLNPSYGDLFNQNDLSNNKEVILWRQYDYVTFGKNYGNDLQTAWPNRSSYSRFAIRSYLCTDGLQLLEVMNLRNIE